MRFEVRFAPSGRSIRVDRGTRLIDAVRRAGLPVASGCGAEGLCARCGMTVLSGGSSLPAESAAEAAAKQRNRIDPAQRLACRVAVESDLEVTASYW
jgi:adenylate cyclase